MHKEGSRNTSAGREGPRGPGGAGPGEAAEGEPPKKTTGLAEASLVCGILGLLTCGLSSIAGIVLGIVGLSKIKRSDGRLGGKGLATAGISVSVATLGLFLLAAFVLLSREPRSGVGVAQAGGATESQSKCLNNLKQLALGFAQYVLEYGEQFPGPEKWCDAVWPYVPANEVFQCAEAAYVRCAYACNENLRGLKTVDISEPGRTVVLFESDGGWNASGGREAMVPFARHPDGYPMLFADLHVEIIPEEELDRLIWNPK